jgi:hypothetical protein
VTLTATVRNFSVKSNTKPFDVVFYLGDPDAGGVRIGDPQTGSGDQRIYAVIDPTNQLPEVHDETDAYINNNKGYGVLRLGAIDFMDMGEAAERVYYPIAYGLNPTMQATLYVPVGNLAQNTRFDLQDAKLSVTGIAGKAFEVLAYRGEGNWDNPEESYSFRARPDDPPAVMTLSYADRDIAGMDESSLTLWRLARTGWEEATCLGYESHRFTDGNLLAVPLCEASVFALSDQRPIAEHEIYSPLVLRSR